ncbi:hypothetical protein VP01_2874g1 [Puccinia sorghi]|uniref:Uncharacterized protein n=1 Tax=Puccinia sorghi TaxID=27349 RepID=A0A0L6V2J0_9BASI|nr:hypothetical protein VP01_2874g1 [Puccinia sorghi]
MNKDEQVSLYLSVEKISKDINQFNSLANNAFQKNHDVMVEHKMPDFGDPKLHTSEGNNFSAASLASNQCKSKGVYSNGWMDKYKYVEKNDFRLSFFK